MKIEIDVKISKPDSIAHTENIATLTKGTDTIGKFRLSVAHL